MQNIDARSKRAITCFTPFRGRVGLHQHSLIQGDRINRSRYRNAVADLL
jgi:hypothetical protein